MAAKKPVVKRPPGLPPGDYNVLLRKNGYSPKRANVKRQCTRFTRRILRLVLPP